MIGAAWRRTLNDDRSYHAINLNEFSFTVPIYAYQVEGEGGLSLIWSRPNRD
ncbi:DUF736 family protein [Ancylobacter oerskovii]|uniref:DUF736 family protein n=1 Tax=Ancylobacter oerskovii TaxID=459519 RepID=A0ABW4Z4I0_9HYPH|nr:DUF736 family protein [Ancylobacter oerskovii]MBS7543049.1 DUF736 family protein [Ancylobacter oerskovii]